MFESLRDLYNEYLPDLLLLAAKRSKLNVRRLSQLHKAETGQGLSPAQYRDIADDMTQDALANHWERYCAYCADLEREGELSCALAELDDKQMTEVFVSPAKEVFLRLNHNPEFVTVRHLIEGYEWNVPTDDFLNNWTCK